MKNKLSVIVNTHSSVKDVWEIFESQFIKHFKNINTYNIEYYCFSNVEMYSKIFKTILYDNNDAYNKQFYNCIKHIITPYVLHLEEDYILYDDAKINDIMKLIDILDNTDLDFIKLIKGPEKLKKSKYGNYLYELDNNDSNFYTNQATLWGTRILQKIYEISPDMGIANKGNLPMFEPNAWKLCKYLGVKGTFYYKGEALRGKAHHDSEIFPYIATAIIKGKWNIKEYSNELIPLLNEHKINKNIRGIVN